MARTPVGSVKRCTKCKKEKRFSQDKEQSEFYPRTRKPSGLIVSWQSWCKVCIRRSNRIRLGKQRAGKPYKSRARNKLTPAQRKQRAREQYAEKMKDPEFAARRREYDRIYANAQRRAAGIPPRNFKNGPVKINGGHADSKYGKDSSIDATLLIAYIEKLIEDEQRNLKSLGLVNADPMAWTNLARRAGVSTSALRRMKSTGRISLDTADKLMTVAGVPLNEIIPEHS